MLRVTLCIALLVWSCCSAPCDRPTNPTDMVPPTNPCIYYIGRTIVTNSGKSVSWDWTSVQLSFKFEGSSVGVVLGGGSNEYEAYIDGRLVTIVNTTSGQNQYDIAKGLTAGVHTLQFQKRTEAFFGVQDFYGIVLDSGSWLQPNNPPATRRLEIFGDSISCGYGDEGVFPCSFSAGTENGLLSWGAKIAQNFEAEYHLQCWSGKGVVRNYGDQHITSPDPFPIYFNRSLANEANIIWTFNSWVPNAVMINLGTNDYSTNPAPPQNVFNDGYNTFIQNIRTKYNNPNLPVFLACGPMIGNPCCEYVKQLVTQNANNHYLDFQGVSGPLGCDYHPSVALHEKLATIAIPVVGKALGWS